MNTDGDCRDYELYEKETLIDLIIEKDKVITQKTNEVNRLQEDLQKLKEDNEHLHQELVIATSKLRGIGNDSEVEVDEKLKNYETEPLPPEESQIKTEYEDKPMPDWTDTTNDLASAISDVVRATAEAELMNIESEQNGSNLKNEPSGVGDDGDTKSEYVYDASSGYYYHPVTGYYWDPNSGLFYDYTSGTYYHYNEASGEYDVHSQVDAQSSSVSSKTAPKRTKPLTTPDNEFHLALKRKTSSKRRLKHKAAKTSKKHKSRNDTKEKDIISGQVDLEDKEKKAADESDFDDVSSGSLATDESELVSDPESGEIVSSSSSDVEVVGEDIAWETTVDISATEQLYPEAMAENYPPCIRVVVQESERLCAGTLFIVTCAGGTIGRDTSAKHTIEIPDIGVSKSHARIDYDYDASCYKVSDLGSQNGTRLNGTRLLCQNKLGNADRSLDHGDVLQLGLTTSLLLHIHKGHETCEDCEPGQVQARLKANNSVKQTHVVVTKAQKKQQQKKELKNIKKKYGLQNSYFENEGAIPTDPNYVDKAHLRRKFIGSETDSTKTDQPASVHCPIAASNKGHKLLAKMGWKEGQGLGKANAGIAEPINVELRVNQNAGLGSGEGVSLSLDRVQDSNKTKRWTQARQRFNKLAVAQDAFSEQNLEEEVSSTVGAVNVAKNNPLQDVPAIVIPEKHNVPLPSTKLVAKVSKPKIQWHKGESENLSNEICENKDS